MIKEETHITDVQDIEAQINRDFEPMTLDRFEMVQDLLDFDYNTDKYYGELVWNDDEIAVFKCGEEINVDNLHILEFHTLAVKNSDRIPLDPNIPNLHIIATRSFLEENQYTEN